MKFGFESNVSRTVFCISIFLIILINLSVVSAITASIGNARMILRAQTGDTIEKSVLVKNINNEAVKIGIIVSGDLEKDITLIDKEFTLEPGEEKEARFTIKVKKEGTFETKINVQFAPLTTGNGVGLSSTVIVVAEKGPGWFDFGENNSTETNSTSVIQTIFGNNDSGSSSIGKKILIGLSATGIVFVIFLVVLMLYSSRIKKRASHENEKGFKTIKPKKKAGSHD